MAIQQLLIVLGAGLLHAGAHFMTGDHASALLCADLAVGYPWLRRSLKRLQQRTTAERAKRACSRNDSVRYGHRFVSARPDRVGVQNPLGQVISAVEIGWAVAVG